MLRILTFAFGVVCYLLFFGSFLYLIAFVGDFAVPKTVSSGPPTPIGRALAIDVLLVALFGVQHSVMARRGFKEWWTRIVPKPIERSVYVMIASLVLILLYWQWKAPAGSVWAVESAVGRVVLWVLFAVGWAVVLISTFLINHFDLFGLRQVWFALRNEDYRAVHFVRRGFYHLVRHPLMLGFIIAFWATPAMTVSHFVFAVAMTVYILIAIQIEERDLLAMHGEAYDSYRREVSMLLPLPKRK